MKTFRKIPILAFCALAAGAPYLTSVVRAQGAPTAPPPGAPAQTPAPPGGGRIPVVDNGPRTIAPYFSPATRLPKAPDPEGFLQRWLLLEPITKPNRTNTVFTDSYVRAAFATEYFPGQMTVVPKNGDTVTVDGQTLAWHAVDSAGFNVKLFRLAYGLNKTTYGVIFWAVTVVNSPQELKDVRMAVGSNSASMWWLNGKEAVLLSGDRRMVMDDVVSPRLTLNKGRNIIRGAVINGPGLSDFCVRFIDERGKPITGLTLNLEQAGNQ